MEALESLTKRQRKIYEFIRESIRTRGYGPTVREIADKFGIRSPNGVMCHLRALEKKQLIAREPNRSRAIRLLAEPMITRGLPLAGRIAAGQLHEAIEENEVVDFGSFFDDKDGNLFALKVEGNSMIGDHITDGDYVIIRKQRTAPKGAIVVALTEDGEATLKRWYPEGNRIRLQPTNPKLKPIYVKNARVVGVVVGVIRKLK
jgi:repressor LexA